MVRTHGRCPRGERLRMGFPHGHRKTTTDDLRRRPGLTTRGTIAPFVLGGPINRDAFETYVEKVGPRSGAAPRRARDHGQPLEPQGPEDPARALIEAAGASLLFLPPDDFEKELKAWLAPLQALSPEERRGWVCGLGHGVLPNTPEQNVRTFVRTVREVFA